MKPSSTAVKIYTRGRRKECSDYSRKIIELNPRGARRCSIISFTVSTSLAGRCLGSFWPGFFSAFVYVWVNRALSRWWYNTLEIRSARFRPAAFFFHSIFLHILDGKLLEIPLCGTASSPKINATGNFLFHVLQSESLFLIGITGKLDWKRNKMILCMYGMSRK